MQQEMIAFGRVDVNSLVGIECNTVNYPLAHAMDTLGATARPVVVVSNGWDADREMETYTVIYNHDVAYTARFMWEAQPRRFESVNAMIVADEWRYEVLKQFRQQ